MSEDAELLHRYATDHSEAAFTDLVRQHVDLVYSAALRLANGDVHRAEDVTQQVFSELARQANRLTKHPALAGWLYTTARRMALHSLRTEQRRTAREQEATTMNELICETAPTPDWEKLRPVLEDAMHELRDQDRLVVLLRFFQNKSLKDVGQVLGLNENAARMRVERALDKLRNQLARKGVTSTTAALVLALTGNAVVAAPSAFVSTLASASLAGAAPGIVSPLTLLKLMATTKLKAGIVSAIVVASVATSLVIQHQSQAKMREVDASLQQQANQLARLQAENERLAKLAAQTGSPNQLNDLLRLRGEVGLLRKRTNDLATLQEENRRLRARNSQQAEKPKTPLQRREEEHEQAIAKLNFGKDWILAFLMYADKNQEQFPASFEQALPFLPDDAKSGTNVTTDQYEIVYQGSLNAITDPGNVIVLREKEAWPSDRGGWNRAYGFADGHSEIHLSRDGNFEPWEKQKGLKLSGQ